MRRDEPDSQSRHGIILRETVDRQHAVMNFRKAADARARHLVNYDEVINLIRNHQQPRVLFEHLNQLGQLFTRVDRPGRIIRVRQKQYATLPRNVLFELLRRELEVIFGARLDDLELASALRDDVRKREPERRRYQDLLIADGVEDVVQSLRGAVCDDHAFYWIAIGFGNLVPQSS